MKNKKFKASFLLDALTSFGLILTLILLFLPFTINQHQQFRNEIHIAEMNRILITAIHRFKTKELTQGVEIEHYNIKSDYKEICIIDSEIGKKQCIQK
ncbi:hypothetical protein SPI02_13190 [Staphylococcus piscifermentans]|uniref:Late competence protein ComGE n=1 Tax=Staphylococcus piscifermentans TaxID=70258 RepID=A0A512QMQ9_9STAP|nr:hypothetical protein SPI02_13190 [Staphylococcus piscifermentans]